jgi:hypothetical protein
VTAYRDAGAWGLHRDATGAALPESQSEFKAGARTLTLDGTARLPPFAGLDDEERARIYVPAISAPNLFLNVHPDYVNAHMMFPTGPETVADRLRLACSSRAACRSRRRIWITTSRCGSSPIARTHAIASGNSMACIRENSVMASTCRRSSTAIASARWVRTGLRHARRA